MAKPKVAFYWCASCGGCEEAVVDLAEDLLKVAELIDIVLWPVAMDFKKKDIEKMNKGEIAVSFINGAIRTEEQEEMAKLLREKSGLVVAFGSCAHLGGVPGLANLWDRKSIFERVYREAPSVKNPEGIEPKTRFNFNGYELELPEFYDTVRTLDQVVDVDYYVPGCAPPPDLIKEAVMSILEGNLPEKGTVFGSKKALCDTCPLLKSKPDKLILTEIKRPYEVEIEPDKCFLAQNLICFGPATRGGCGERCINANMPCRGCFGPVDNAKDFGARIATAIASIMGTDKEEEMDEEAFNKLIDQIPDPIGLFYMYSLPASLLRRKKL